MLKNIILSFQLLFAVFSFSQTVDSVNIYHRDSAPVVMGEDTLFYIHSSIGPMLSSQKRAEHIQSYVDDFLSNQNFNFDTLFIESDTLSKQTFIDYGNERILIITEKDAALDNTTRDALAISHLDAIKKAHSKYWIKQKWVNLILGLVYGILLIIGLIILIRGSNRLFQKINKIIPKFIEEKVTHGIKIKDLEIVSERQIELFFITFVRWLERALQVFLVYISVVILIYIYPGAQKITDQIISYLLKPIRSIFGMVLEFIPNVFYIVVIVIIARYVLKGLKFMTDAVQSGTLELKGFHKEWIEPTYKIVRFLIFIFTAVMIFPYLPGSSSPAFRGISIFLGVIFSMGSSSSISNMVAGIVLTYMRPFKIGDRVKVAETEGFVVEKNLLVTRIRTIKNVDVSIPNSLILNNHIQNFSSIGEGKHFIFNTSITIGYDVPWEKVHVLMIGACENVQDVLTDPAPFVLQRSLDDYAVCYELNCSLSNADRMEYVESDLHKNIQERFNEAEIEILSPKYTAHRDGNASTIPQETTGAMRKSEGFDLLGKFFK